MTVEFVTFFEGTILFPSSSCAILISNVAKKDAIIMNNDASAKC